MEHAHGLQVDFRQGDVREVEPLKARQRPVHGHETGEVRRQGVPCQRQVPHATQHVQVGVGDGVETVVADVQGEKVGEVKVTEVEQPAPGQVQVHQHAVLPQGLRGQPHALRVQKAQLHKILRAKEARAEEGVPVARAS